MTYLFATLIALVFALLLGRWMASAPAATVARTLRWTLGIVVGLALLVVAWAGRFQLAAVILPFLIPALLRWRSMGRWRRNMQGPTPGQMSTVSTPFLRMTLDHDSGNLDGEVVAGCFAGRRLRDMSLAELLQLYGECAADESSRRILEAYLDRHHGAAWRAGRERREQSAGDTAAGGGRTMTREEAYAILGLQPGADDQAVKTAHRQLMARFHPDRGGSDYLAALINHARDMLLGR